MSLQSYHVTPTCISVSLDNRPRVILSSHMNFKKLRQELKKGENSDLGVIRDLIDIPSFIARVTSGRVQVGDAGVKFDGKPLKNVMCERLIQMMNEGFDIQPMAKFLDKVMDNPSDSAREELFLWLEESQMSFTPDGDFLAYKKVDEEYNSYHRLPDGSKLYNGIGETVTMDRDSVDPDRHQTCSAGLHFAAFSYLSSYYGSTGRVVILKINPANVVAIPEDYNNAKGRAWEYEVVGEVPQNECEDAFSKSVSSGYGDYVWHDYGEQFDDDHEDDLESQLEDVAEMRRTQVNTAIKRGEQAAAQASSKSERTVEHKGVELDIDDVAQSVKDNGQRATARALSVPRTTLQGWLKKFGLKKK